MGKLSFGLPKYEAGMNKLYDEVQHSFHMLDDVLRQFPPRQLIHHGCTRQVSTPRILDTSPRAHESKFTIETENFEDYDYAEHIKHEPQSFQITQRIGARGLVLLSVLLKDRYFPKLWKQIVSENQSSTTNQIGTSGHMA